MFSNLMSQHQVAERCQRYCGALPSRSRKPSEAFSTTSGSAEIEKFSSAGQQQAYLYQTAVELTSRGRGLLGSRLRICAATKWVKTPMRQGLPVVRSM